MDMTPHFSQDGLVNTSKSGKLTVLKYKNRDLIGHAASEAVAELMKNIIDEKGEVRIVFASAMSQTDFLKYLGEKKDIDWTRVHAFHLDEYLNFPSDHDQSFAQFLRDRLFNRVGEAQFHPINSEAADPDEECRRYSGLLTEKPIDIMILGIGESAHLAFIDPPYCDFNDPETFKTTKIDDQSREQMVHDGCFSSIEEVPNRSYTMTVPACLTGLVTIAIVPTKLKAKAVQAVVEGPVVTSVPASILQTKENSWLLIDCDSGMYLSQTTE